jgi:Zn-dependent hydrolases, including glyoxylases
MEIIPVRLNLVNCFLVKAGDRYLLIDTGYEVDWVLFCKKLSEAGVNFSQISHVILTHHHDDHCGLLNYIIKENPNIQVVMSVLAKDLLAEGENDNTHGYHFINKRIRILWLFQLKRLGLMLVTKKYISHKSNLKFSPYQVRENDILITEDTSLKEIGIDLSGRIIKTQGHTVDSISVLLDDGNCFVGDAAANMLQFAGTKYCVIGITNLDQYYRSWQKILDAGAKHIFPAHGSPFSTQKLKQNLGKNKKRNMVMICPECAEGEQSSK